MGAQLEEIEWTATLTWSGPMGAQLEGIEWTATLTWSGPMGAQLEGIEWTATLTWSGPMGAQLEGIEWTATLTWSGPRTQGQRLCRGRARGENVRLVDLGSAGWTFSMYVGKTAFPSMRTQNHHAGFTITKDAIPDYFIWAYWANPVAWGFRALAVNQYRHPDFDVYLYDGVDFCGRYGKTLGRYALDAYSIPSGEYWVSYGVLFMLGSYVLFLFLAAIVLENVRYESPENVSLDNPDDYDSSCDSQRTPVLPSKSSNGMGFELYSSPRSSQVVLEMRHSPRATLFEPVILAFEDLWYSVPDPNDSQQTIDLLKGVSGFALPGTITALMGSSGAGTLMDVIAGRKTGGSIRGRILLNGHEATDIAIRRVTGYCEQADIHSEASTIREALVFSAFLRQSSDVPNSQKYDSLEECLDLLGLRPIADKIIRGSSVEQLKRISIGVELVAQPSVLFLDEPTSGLDARSAKLIMDGVRKVAYTGRTVVCTIHQPSSEVFQFFDSLLLLKRGGETVFFGELGPQAHELIKYFEAIPGILPLEPEYNPASWMLDVIGAGVSNGKDTAALDEEDETDFAGFWRISEKKARLDVNLRRPGLCSPVTGSAALRFKAKRAASEWTQASFLLDTSATCIGARQTTP